MTFLFLITFIPKFDIKVKADSANLPKADMMAVLVGDFVSDAGLGSNWDPMNKGTIMKEYSKGIYELTVNFTKTGQFNYKAAFNGQWDNPKALGNNGDNKALNVTTTGSVTFRVDAVKGVVYDTINDPSQFKTTATVTGSFGTDGDPAYWNPAYSANDIQYIGGGFYKGTLSLKAGSYEYKVAYNHSWGNGETGSNVKLSLASGGNVTFLANPVTGVCTDSINTPAIANTVSLIGEIRNAGNDNWNEKATGYEMSYAGGDGKYIYSGFFPAGTYLYKASLNYSWDNPIPGGTNNNSITIPDGGKYVVFVCDVSSGKLYDSINNYSDVAMSLGLQVAPTVVKSPVINPNGTVTFSYMDKVNTSVYLAGDMTDWQNGKLPMVKNPNTNIWSITLRVGDAVKNHEYKFIVDNNWITDPLNENTSNGNSSFAFPQYNGRKVVIAGSIQTAAGESAWTPSSDKTAMIYDGNGLYHLTIPNVPAGNYEYKIAMGSWDPENYGAGGVSYGPNMKLNVPSAQDVTFWYSDDSHYTVESVDYKKLDISLTGTGIPDGTKLTDTLLTGIYSTKITLNKGTYNDIKAVIGTNTYDFGTIDVSEAPKTVTFSFDPITEMAFNDASSLKVDTANLYFDSRDIQYKSPYGAVISGSEVTFNLKAGKDITAAKLILLTNSGTKKIPMELNGSFDTDHNKWTVKYAFDQVEMDKYYFVVSNGSDVKAYSDDDGYYGPGTAGSLNSVKPYGINIYYKNYETPDWLKNAVIYQIFPERFFNGDLTNDYNQKLARGTTPYEFYSDWYGIPEDPAMEYKTDSKGKVIKDAAGNPVLNPDYKGTIGDGNWGNEMYGGDLEGIADKLNYLKSLGVTVIYLNPVSQSISNHRYDTTDYRNIDPLLGHTEDFVNLAQEAHKLGMHVILDGVFNHVSDDSVYFDRYGKYVAAGKPLGAYQYWAKVYNLMNTTGGLSIQDAEKQTQDYFKSKGITDFHYKDWFKIDNVKVAAVDNDPEHYQYEGWWGYDSMPVIQALNGSEYQVASWANEIIDGPDANSRYWLKEGSNGWRLDVANEVSDETWRHFRQAVKSEGDNAIIGEIWDDASKYLLGDMYDSVMNYRFRNAVLYFVKGTTDDGKTPTTAFDAMNQLELIREEYPKQAFESMMNLVDSHDTQRAISALDGFQKGAKGVAEQPSQEALNKMKLISLIQMTYPGAPTIYYGDEAGETGADDPDCRRGMIWGEGNKDLVDWYAELANIRSTYSVLRTGDIVPAAVPQDYQNDVMAYLRSNKDNNALVVVNRKDTAVTGLQLSIPDTLKGTKLTNVLNPSDKYTIVDGKVTVDVPAGSGLILVSKYNHVDINENALKDAYSPEFKVQEKLIPVKDEDVKAQIDSAKPGTPVTVSSFDELVDNEVLKEAVNKGVAAGFDRSNGVKITISSKALSTIIKALEENALPGLILSQHSESEKDNKVKVVPEGSIIRHLALDSNLPKGDFGGDVTVNVALSQDETAKVKDKSLHVYYYNPTTKMLEDMNAVYNNGVITFNTAHSGDYFISSKDLKKWK